MKLTKEQCFEILGVSPDADELEIRSAYRKLALKTHPDKNKDDPESHKKFLEVSEAYKRTIDPDSFKEEDVTDMSEEQAYKMNAMFNMMFAQMLATSLHTCGKSSGMNMFDIMSMMMTHDDDDSDDDSEVYNDDDDDEWNHSNGFMASMTFGRSGFDLPCGRHGARGRFMNSSSATSSGRMKKCRPKIRRLYKKSLYKKKHDPVDQTTMSGSDGSSNNSNSSNGHSVEEKIRSKSSTQTHKLTKKHNKLRPVKKRQYSAVAEGEFGLRADYCTTYVDSPAGGLSVRLDFQLF
jgi:curved DNA-binding protein CbpA